MTESKRIVEVLRDRSVIGVNIEIAAANHIESQDKLIAELRSKISKFIYGEENPNWVDPEQAKIIELQAVVDRLADKKWLMDCSGKHRAEVIEAELSARIELAVKHAAQKKR